MLPLLAAWKVSRVVRTYVIFARTRGSCATRRRHRQRLAEHRSNAAASREGGFRGELTQMAGRGELIENDLGGGASGDEFARLESAADTLHRAGINPKLLSDLSHARPSGNRQSLPNALFQRWSYRRPTQTFPLALGPR